MDLDVLLAALSDDAPGPDEYPAGGALAGVVTALAASLAAAAADWSRSDWSEAGGARAQAQALRLRAAGLARRDALAYAPARQALTEWRSDSAAGASDDEERNLRLGSLVEQAAEAPLALAASAADVAELAREIAARGSPDIRADATIAAVLAAAASRSAAQLVTINLVVGADPEVAARARASAEAAAVAAAAATELSG